MVEPGLITAAILGLVEGLTEFLPVLEYRPPDRRRFAARLHRRQGQAVRDRDPGRRHPGSLLGIPVAA